MLDKNINNKEEIMKYLKSKEVLVDNIINY